MPEKSVANTLTSSDLNELGCTSSTSAKSTASSSGISSAKSEAHSATKRRSSSTSQLPSATVRSSSLLSLFRKSRSTHTKPTQTIRSRSTAVTTEEKSSHKRERDSSRRNAGSSTRSSNRIFVEILRTLTSGFANCSRKANDEDGHSRRGSNSCSNSDAISNNLDLLNQFPNSQSRRKSHDGSHDGTNGSDSTSTGYVSDSSNEKHYPKNNKSSTNSDKNASMMNSSMMVTTISKQVDDAQAAEDRIATAWSDAIKAAATIRPLYDTKKSDSPPEGDKETDESDGKEHAPPSGSGGSNRDIAGCSSDTRGNSYERVGGEAAFCYVENSVTEDSGTEDSLYTSGSESGSSDYETNETSSYEDETDEKEIKATKRQHLDIIKEEDEEEAERPKKSVKRRKSTLKRKRTLKGQEDLKSGMKSTLASLKAKDEDAVSRTGSLKDMILQFETAVAALEIGEANAQRETEYAGKDIQKSPLQGVKAIAQKIQEQSQLETTIEVEQMPPSQILKLKQALELEPEKDLAHPIPLSRRSESKVAQIARQLAEAERQRVAAEKEHAAKNGGKSPKATKKQSSTSFINELLEMARAESVDKLNETETHDAAPDFKQSLLAARKKITQREEEVKQSQTAAGATATAASNATPLLTIQSTMSATSLSSEGSSTADGAVGPIINEEIDPFVKEVLRSKTVPEPVKQKIRIECWSLFNDPRTPKGVKQCILATMLSKVQNE